MRIVRQGDFWFVEHITGPTHNALLVSFAEGNQGLAPTIEALPLIGKSRPQDLGLNPDIILAKVLAGTDEGNRQFGTQYTVKEVRYYLDDSRPEAVYHYMALKLVEHFANISGGESGNKEC